MLYERKCPNCNKEIFHKNEKNRNESHSLKRLCASCNVARRNKMQKGKPISKICYM